ncbi:hypothetical protein RBSWK_05805 [Rhodopirellula baltica SWK14]|uniref:Uncharacterized protein n=1 Tax=Rhodopirellula baltica SWK14 TaxID=993516 RepID=L7C8B8_RHOBT|nr:hypothetical protein RBSWK_05805 [Rhodopirellula baltica SWK14]
MPTRRRRVDSPGSITNFKRAVTGVASKGTSNSHGEGLVPTKRNQTKIRIKTLLNQHDSYAFT